MKIHSFDPVLCPARPVDVRRDGLGREQEAVGSKIVTPANGVGWLGFYPSVHPGAAGGSLVRKDEG